jgi:hypothetical protein
MSVIHYPKLRAVSALIALMVPLFLALTADAQLIGLSPSITGSSNQATAVSKGSTLGFSNIKANDVNMDRCIKMLDYVVPAPTAPETPHIELSIGSQLPEIDAAWWPRLNLSETKVADSMTEHFLTRFSTRYSHGLSELRGANLLGAGNAGKEGAGLPTMAGVDGDFVRAGLPDESWSSYGAADGSSLIGRPSFLGQSPLSSPEPGGLALISAICCVPALIALQRRWSARR